MGTGEYNQAVFLEITKPLHGPFGMLLAKQHRMQRYRV